MIDPTSTLGTLVNEGSQRARVLERFGLDYCCGGQRSLAEACQTAGVSINEVTAALIEAPNADSDDWVSMTDTELVHHLVDTHHRFLWEELPRISALAEKVTTVHGANHPELTELRETYETLRADLEPHLMKEERILFPAIERLDETDGMAQFGFGSIANPISMMLTEHDTAGELLFRLRKLTDGYTAPPEACASYHAYYSALAALEADTHQHIHKENNTLFPRVIQRQHQPA